MGKFKNRQGDKNNGKTHWKQTFKQINFTTHVYLLN